MKWLVRSPRFPDAVIPVRDEAHALATIAAFRATAKSHRSKVVWEYGLYDPTVPDSYRRIGPRPLPKKGNKEDE
jgi:hypothetical protein